MASSSARQQRTTRSKDQTRCVCSSSRDRRSNRRSTNLFRPVHFFWKFSEPGREQQQLVDFVSGYGKRGLFGRSSENVPREPLQFLSLPSRLRLRQLGTHYSSLHNVDAIIA